MPHSAFDNPTYDPSSRLIAVGGPFVAETASPVLGPVAVRWVLIQGPPHQDQSEEDANAAPLIIHGLGEAATGASEWSGSQVLTQAQGNALRADEIRAVATAVMVRPAVAQQPAPDPAPPHPDPPFMDTFTWCVDRTVVFVHSEA